uniref:Dehydrin DHN3 n=1 Tax=Aegilops tauschii TaxID=37682 RepID=M8BYY7_AEGTA
MAHFQGQQHGHPATRVDEYGNPVPAGHGVTGTEGLGHFPGQAQQHGHNTTRLDEYGNPSSSEDDGMGGRRKKGMKQKIKEKLPGGNKEQTTAAGGYGPGYTGTTGTGGPGYTGTTGTGGAYGATEGTHEKKGVMEKIKQKLPGGHKDTQPHTTATGGDGPGTTGTTGTGGYGTGTTGTAGTHGATEGTHEKKGMMEKIKEKLPGGHH